MPGGELTKLLVDHGSAPHRYDSETQQYANAYITSLSWLWMAASDCSSPVVDPKGRQHAESVLRVMGDRSHAVSLGLEADRKAHDCGLVVFLEADEQDTACSPRTIGDHHDN